MMSEYNLEIFNVQQTAVRTPVGLKSQAILAIGVMASGKILKEKVVFRGKKFKDLKKLMI